MAARPVPARPLSVPDAAVARRRHRRQAVGQRRAFRAIPLKETLMKNRRTFIQQSAAAASTLACPLVGGAQPAAVKIGVLHPVTGALAFSGQQCRDGALMAIEDINKAGGLKGLGGARIEAVLGDAQSQPQVGAAEVEKMN